MPHWSEFLTAPWNLLGILLRSLFTTPPTGFHPVGSTASGAAAIPSGICFYEDVGGQLLHTCRFAGYAMPSFVFWASFLIFILFAFSSAYLFFQCWKLTQLLQKVAKQVDKIAHPDGKGIGNPALSKIRSLMQAPALRHSWHLFEETLLLSPKSDEIFTTQSAESIFSKSAVIEDNVHGAFFATVPGILTGIGLLMTFVAILDGLSHVTVTANMDVQGIGGLINGLSGKFVSSITAVTCAVLFVIVERIAFTLPHSAYHNLVHCLSVRFRRKTTEHLLFSIQEQLNTQATLQREFAQHLAIIQKTPPEPRTSRGG